MMRLLSICKRVLKLGFRKDSKMYNQEKPYIIRYQPQNFTLAYADLHKAILKADEFKRPVIDERNGKIVYEPKLENSGQNGEF